MCAVSMILDYGMNKIPPTQWDRPMLGDFLMLVEQAKNFDEKHDQPDCEQADKVRWMKDLIERIGRTAPTTEPAHHPSADTEAKGSV